MGTAPPLIVEQLIRAINRTELRLRCIEGDVQNEFHSSWKSLEHFTVAVRETVSQFEAQLEILSCHLPESIRPVLELLDSRLGELYSRIRVESATPTKREITRDAILQWLENVAIQVRLFREELVRFRCEVASSIIQPTDNSTEQPDDSPIAGPLQVYIDTDAYSAEEKATLLSLISELYSLQGNDRLVIDNTGTAETVLAEVLGPNGGLS